MFDFVDWKNVFETFLQVCVSLVIFFHNFFDVVVEFKFGVSAERRSTCAFIHRKIAAIITYSLQTTFQGDCAFSCASAYSIS